MEDKQLGHRIRRLRDQRAWTQEHLAGAAGVSVRTIQRAEEGVLSAETLGAIAGALDEPVEVLARPPSRYPRCTPFLIYDDPASFDWLVATFGFEVRMKVPGPDGRIVHGELCLGDGLIMVATSSGQARTPRSLDGAYTQGVYARVDDVGAHHARARDRGATIISPPEDAHGHRRYQVEDPEGHHWMFFQELDR